MNAIKFSLVPLRQASLCLDCDMISAAHTHCAACGSAALLNLARTLDGKGYGDLMPKPIAMAHISARGAFKPVPISNMRPRQHRPVVRECLPFPQTGDKRPTEAGDAHRWYSLRDVAAIAHRAMTMALLAVVMRECALAPPPSALASRETTGCERSHAPNSQKESCNV
jgi:hypothetical protein